MKLTKRQRRRLRIKQNMSNEFVRFGAGFCVGDCVRVIGNTELLHHFEIGIVGRIYLIDRDGYCYVRIPLSERGQWIAKCDLELWEE